MKREHRGSNHKPTIETRDDGASVISGYASVFYDQSQERDTQYELGMGMVERIMPGAFNRALAEKQDVRGLFNHDSNKLLGRTANGTMTLSVDSKGLRYDITLNPNDPDHQSVREKLARGDLTGSSFGFIPKKASWRELEGELLYREIEDVDLFDVGPVTFPAYTGATSGLRSGGEEELVALKAEAAAALKANRNHTAEVDARLRAIQIDSDTLAL